MRSPSVCQLSLYTCFLLLVLLLMGEMTNVGANNRRGKTKTGQDCERGTHRCHKDAVCINTRRSHRCRCKPGYYGDSDGKLCIDYNECDFENGGCVHSCQNTPGNYTCSCLPGFELDTDRHDCIDINECFENKGGCQHQCVNTLGSYECKCNAGYGINPDGRTCVLGTWCQTKLGCGHYCRSAPQGLHCACRDHYVLHPNGKDCLATCQVGNGGCQHICTDTPDGPVCSCAPKYILRDDKKTCIASCGVNNGGCERKCNDTKDGPRCSCPRGYHLHQDGRSCLDIDECQTNNGDCSHQCLNTHGSFECVCPQGFKVSLDQTSCVDIDECALNSTCDHICINTPGSFQCQCREGYQEYGRTHCADVDECSINKGDCAHACKNSPGSYTCLCPPGHKLHPNGKDCIEAARCITLKVHAKASKTCRNLGGEEQHCQLQCHGKAQFTDTRPSPMELTCGPSTGHRWTFERENTSLPTCSDTVLPPSIKRKARFIMIMDECHFQKNVQESVASNLTKILRGQKRYKCNKKKCRVNYVELRCGSRRKKFLRMVRGSGRVLVTAEFELQMDARRPSARCDAACVSKRTGRKLKKAFKTMKRNIRKDKFSLRIGNRDVMALRKSFKPEKGTSITCVPGNVLVGNQCVACSVGTYYEAGQGRCLPCPGGSYQSREGQLNCRPCPNRSPGVGVVGARSQAECSELCDPGFYSEDGSKPCRPCALGSYQPDHGRTSCRQCGPGLTTSAMAATRFRDCSIKEVCRPGHYYQVEQARCLPCPLGAYQPEEGQNFCVQCPGETSTDFTASTRAEDCKNQSCGGYMGQYHGVIETPNYPGDYPNNARCTWKIRPEKRRRILVIIPEVSLRSDDKCGDVLVMRKSKSPYSVSTFETCESRSTPIAFTALSKKLWIHFKTDGNNTARGFSIPFVTYNEEYQSLIEDIVRDGRLYNSYQHQQIFKDRKLLNALLEVIAQPYNYLKYANVSHTMFPQSFFRLLTPKVRKFFST